MLYLILFSALALGFYAQTNMSAQVSRSERKATEAQVATECGLHFLRYHLSAIDIPPQLAANKVFEEVYLQLGTKLDGTANLNGGVCGYTPTEISIPQGADSYVSVGSLGKFRALLTPVGTLIRLKIIGSSPDSRIRRAVQIDFYPVKRYGMVGQDFLTFNGQGVLDGYDSSVGPYAAATATPSALGSNGTITMTGNTTIKGDATPGVGKTVVKTANDTVSGSMAPLTASMPYPPVNPGSAATVNNNASIPVGFLSSGALTIAANKTCTLPGGVYYVTGFTMAKPSTLTMTGPVTLYVAGNVSLKGTINTFQNKPANFKLRVCKPATTVDVLMVGSLYGIIEAPESAVSFGGENTIDLFGALMGKSITLLGNTNIHTDRRAVAGGYYAPTTNSYLEVLP
jgi:hypothetical protein